MKEELNQYILLGRDAQSAEQDDAVAVVCESGRDGSLVLMNPHAVEALQAKYPDLIIELNISDYRLSEE